MRRPYGQVLRVIAVHYSGIAAQISWTANQHEAPITIAALRIAFFINLEPDARMAQRCATGNITGAVTAGSAVMGANCFRVVAHVCELATGGERIN